MSLWDRLLDWLGLRQISRSRYYAFDEPLQTKLASLAKQEGRTEEEIAADLLAAGLQDYSIESYLLYGWRSLSPREQDVAALLCLGYTNRQIATQLGVSAETVKSHLRKILAKFNLHSRTELRLLFSNWDFSAWER